MIFRLKEGTSEERGQEIAEASSGFLIKTPEGFDVITSSKMKEVNNQFADEVVMSWVFDSDIQLASRTYKEETREVTIGKQVIGGSTGNCLMIAGPCSVESLEQIQASAECMKDLGIQALRGGCYKPRTSPYSFQGLGLDGLKLLAQMREEHGFAVVTEVRDATHVDKVIEYSDVVQVGAKAMYDQGILRACGRMRKPVLLKRGFGTTLQEFVQAAEFILSLGNDQVVLCERGIRTFVTKTRFTLDLCGVAYLKEHTNLPIILDPSHAMGYAYGIPDLTRACVAMGVDGLIIEVHPEPKVALSDAAQQLDFETFRTLYNTLGPVAASVGRQIV